MNRRVRLDASFAAPMLGQMAPEPKRRMKDALRRLAQDPTGHSVDLDVKELEHAASAVAHFFERSVAGGRACGLVTGGG